MASELDQLMDGVMAALTADGAPMALTTIERAGVSYPAIAGVPPTASGYFAHFCNEHAEKTFIVDGDERLTFAQVYDAARRAAGGLVEGHGVAPGERIGIAARNGTAWIISYMAILMAGGVATLLNGWWQSGELLAGIKDVDCKLVIADPQRAKRIIESGADVPIITLDFDLDMEGAIAPLMAKGGGKNTALPDITPEDLATILFTSGSTGQSKGAYSDHRAVMQATFNYLCQTLMMLEIMTRRGEAPTLQPATLLNVPLFHVTAEIPVFMQSFAMGRKLVLMPKWDAEEAMRLMQAEQITYFVGVPLMSFEIMTHPNRAKYDISTVRDFAAGGAPRPEEHVKRLHEEMGGARPLIGYGLTETNAVGCGNFAENYIAKPNSAGRASKPLVEFGILDDDGNVLAQGERGEICIRSICNFSGYWNNDAATKAAITPDGWFRSGDIGYLDAEGYLYIVDRKKDIIIRGGENISCIEVEAAIYEHPAVAEAAVFGIACERFGEIPAAVVHFHEGETVTVEVLQAFLNEHLAAFKVPGLVWVSEQPLPRLGTEKIDKVSIRNVYSALAVD